MKPPIDAIDIAPIFLARRFRPRPSRHGAIPAGHYLRSPRAFLSLPEATRPDFQRRRRIDDDFISTISRRVKMISRWLI